MTASKKLQSTLANAGGSGGDSIISSAVYNGSPINWFTVSSEEASPEGLTFKPDGTKMYVIGGSGGAVYEYSLSTAWDISTASYAQSFSVATEEGSPQTIAFKPDGTKMYVVGGNEDDINEYSLSTAWDISTASYNQSFNVSAQEASPRGIFFKPDGTKMYVAGSSGDEVNEYSLSTAWDVSTASYVQNFSVTNEMLNPETISFKDDGTKMYIIGSSREVVEYSLSTAWDISTASYNQSFSVANEASSPTEMTFKPDGTKMYVVGSASDTVFSYSLSTAWDISTASWDAPSTEYFSVDSQENAPSGLFFKPDGTKMYVIGYTLDVVTEYSLSTAWDITTASSVGSFSVATEETAPRGVTFKTDGTKMYVVGSSGDDVNEYSLSTAWDVTTASYVQNFSVFTEETIPRGVSFKTDGTKMYVIGSSSEAIWVYSLSTAWDISTSSIPDYGKFYVGNQGVYPQGVTFKPDGTKMYVIGSSSDSVHEYSLSTAWDITTASHAQSYSVATSASYPQGVTFKTDGTKMYVVDSAGDSVIEYSLSTAWDVTTASSVESFSVTNEDGTPVAISFKPDGTKMYFFGQNNDSVYEYSLSTAWDISTASYVQSFSVATEAETVRGFFFKPDGTKMYVADDEGDDVKEYSLSTAWDISTASYNQSFSVATQETSPAEVSFKDDGTKMYVIGYSTDSVYSYSLSTAWDISTASFDSPSNSYFNLTAQETSPEEVFFKDDGTKMYVVGSSSDSVHEYILSSAWDVTTASYVESFSVLSEEAAPQGIAFKPDDTKMYIVGSYRDAVLSYDLEG
jgi:DNA-binding beta-propeller fold protein YncE